MKRFSFLVLLLASCGLGYVDTYVVPGVPNVAYFAPKMIRMGQPATDQAWRDLAEQLGITGPVVVVKLDDETEGSDHGAEMLGWTVVRIPMPPYDDKPWTVLEEPSTQDVRHAVDVIVDAHQKGWTVLWHCVHGRDRTSLVAAMTGERMFGWSKRQAWDDMIRHGFRWMLPDLDAYFEENG